MDTNDDSHSVTIESKSHCPSPISSRGDEEKLFTGEKHFETFTDSRVSNAEIATVAAATTTSHYLSGWRLHLCTLAVLLGLFLVNMEVSIVSTALVAITKDLSSFDETSWVVTAFLSTYTGFIIIWSKLSDILGRKNILLATSLIFIAFSGGCGGASTMFQLIICRAFQGIGAAGIYSVSVLIIYELVPRTKLPIYGSLVALVVALATALGPLLGGAIAQGSATWRWTFFINLPFGFVSMMLLFLAMPAGFPNHGAAKQAPSKFKDIFNKIDFLGTLFLLGGTILLVVALFEGSTGTTDSWSTPRVMILFVFAGVSYLSFFLWEWYITFAESKSEPIFPFRFFYNRAWMGMLLVSLFVGFPFNVVVVSLPQRFQIISETTPVEAGVRLLPYVLGASVASIFSNVLCSKLKIPFIGMLLAGAVLQIIGLVLLSTTIMDLTWPGVAYFEELLAGVGLGTSFSILILATPFVCDKRDLGVATGAVIQLRFLAGAIGLAIASAITNLFLETQLVGVLSGEQIAHLLQDITIIKSFDNQAQTAVKLALAQSYDLQFKIMAGVSAAQILAAFLMWRSGNQHRTL